MTDAPDQKRTSRRSGDDPGGKPGPEKRPPPEREDDWGKGSGRQRDVQRRPEDQRARPDPEDVTDPD